MLYYGNFKRPLAKEINTVTTMAKERSLKTLEDCRNLLKRRIV